MENAKGLLKLIDNLLIVQLYIGGNVDGVKIDDDDVDWDESDDEDDFSDDAASSSEDEQEIIEHIIELKMIFDRQIKEMIELKEENRRLLSQIAGLTK